jgi:hypothetical protein
MTKKKLEARSSLGPIAQALIQDHLGPDRKVTDVEGFFTAPTQILHNAYALGWKDCREVKGHQMSKEPVLSKRRARRRFIVSKNGSYEATLSVLDGSRS